MPAFPGRGRGSAQEAPTQGSRGMWYVAWGFYGREGGDMARGVHSTSNRISGDATPVLGITLF